MKRTSSEIRLPNEVVKAIKALLKKHFGENVKAWIFGSRVDPTARGGDIDIYVEVYPYENSLSKKLDFLVELEKIIGEQKVDLVVKLHGSSDFISLEAKQTGIRIL